MTTTDLDAARCSVEAMNKQAEELKGMHDQSERAREETKAALGRPPPGLEKRGARGDSRGTARGCAGRRPRSRRSSRRRAHSWRPRRKPPRVSRLRLLR